MGVKTTSFVGLITFDASRKHAEISKFLFDRGFQKKSLNGYDISFNTYIGVVERDVEINSDGAFPARYLKAQSDRLADKFREDLKDFFNENDIDGTVYVLFSWKMSADDSTSR